jgi:hypothetical protein
VYSGVETGNPSGSHASHSKIGKWRKDAKSKVVHAHRSKFGVGQSAPLNANNGSRLKREVPWIRGQFVREVLQKNCLPEIGFPQILKRAFMTNTDRKAQANTSSSRGTNKTHRTQVSARNE